MENDDEFPRCTEGECFIPELDERGAKVLEMRTRLHNLADFNIGEEVLRMYGADMEDICLLADPEIICLLREIEEQSRQSPDNQNG